MIKQFLLFSLYTENGFDLLSPILKIFLVLEIL